MTATTYVLDTSVLLSAPRALLAFAEHAVVIPLAVVKELEGKRHDPLLGHQARTSLRLLEELRSASGANIKEGVTVNAEGGTVRIEVNHVGTSGLPDALARDLSNDTRILAVAHNLHLDPAVDGNVVVVSKDLPMRLLAETIGLTAQEYLNEQVPVDENYTGLAEVDTTRALVDDLYRSGEVPVPADHADLIPHTGVTFQPSSGGGSALAVRTHAKTYRLVRGDREVFGLTGRSAEQRIAIDHLLNPDIGIVSLGGKAGTGKTLLALAAGLEQVMEKKRYKKIVVFRPLFAVGGQDLGFLPGTEAEKMDPWGAAIFDALRALSGEDVVDEIIDRKIIDILPLSHIRGRTLADTWVVVDEAQNLERPVLLTALSRLGENSKVVLSWDVAQRDNLRVGRYDGIAAVVERLKGEPLFAHTTMSKSERSKIAEMVTTRLDDFDS